MSLFFGLQLWCDHLAAMVDCALSCELKWPFSPWAAFISMFDTCDMNQELWLFLTRFIICWTGTKRKYFYLSSIYLPCSPSPSPLTPLPPPPSPFGGGCWMHVVHAYMHADIHIHSHTYGDQRLSSDIFPTRLPQSHLLAGWSVSTFSGFSWLRLLVLGLQMNTNTSYLCLHAFKHWAILVGPKSSLKIVPGQ